MFQDFDLNNDGLLSKEELVAGRFLIVINLIYANRL